MSRIYVLALLAIITMVIFADGAQAQGGEEGAVHAEDDNLLDLGGQNERGERPDDPEEEGLIVIADEESTTTVESEGSQQQQEDKSDNGDYAAPAHTTQPTEAESIFYDAVDALYIHKNFTHAIDSLHKAASLGHGNSMSLLAMFYSHGIGVNRSEAKAVLYHEFAARSGSLESHLALSHRYKLGIGVPQSCNLAGIHARIAANHVAQKFAQDLNAKVPMTDLEKEESTDSNDLNVRSDLVNVHYFRAEKGQSESKMFLAYSYMLGLNGVEQDGHLAERYFKESAELGNAAAHGGLGQLFSQGVSSAKPPIEKDFNLALHHFQEGARENHAVSLNGLGYLYAQGNGVDQDFETAAKFFRQSHTQNNAEGTYNLAVLTLNGKGVPKSPTEAATLFTQAAFRGSVLANWQLGHLSLKGVGVGKSCNAALKNFGLVLERGPWIKRIKVAEEAFREGDTAASLIDYLIAAEAGYEIALKNAAFILSRGHTFDDGVEILRGNHSMSQEEASNQILLALLRRSAQEGNNEAHLRLGDAYYEGRGVDQNLEKAEEHYSIAAARNHPQALFNLGLLHQYGGSSGIKQDFFLAKRYFDNVMEVSPSSYYAAKAALFWLNWHWWYTHFSSLDRIDWWSFFSGSETIPRPGASGEATTTETTAPKKGKGSSSSGGGFIHNLLRFEKVLPQVMGYPLDTFLLYLFTSLACILLLIRHHAA